MVNCTICFEEVIGEGASPSVCIHIYHLDCLNEWIGRSRNPRDGASPCPICQRTFRDINIWLDLEEDSDSDDDGMREGGRIEAPWNAADLPAEQPRVRNEEREPEVAEAMDAHYERMDDGPAEGEGELVQEDHDVVEELSNAGVNQEADDIGGDAMEVGDGEYGAAEEAGADVAEAEVNVAIPGNEEENADEGRLQEGEEAPNAIMPAVGTWMPALDCVVCHICGHTFNNTSAKSQHVAIHNPEPFRCRTCGATFLYASSLRAHMRRRRH